MSCGSSGDDGARSADMDDVEHAARQGRMEMIGDARKPEARK